MKITINVTQGDIDSKSTGPNICVHCPIARAVRRIKRFKDCTIGVYSINSHLPLFHVVANLPNEVSHWIRKYGYSSSDRSTAKPFKFTVEVKDENA